jgi:hypothetical protein
MSVGKQGRKQEFETSIQLPAASNCTRTHGSSTRGGVVVVTWFTTYKYDKNTLARQEVAWWW